MKNRLTPLPVGFFMFEYAEDRSPRPYQFQPPWKGSGYLFHLPDIGYLHE